MESLPLNTILEFKPDTLAAIRSSYDLDERRINEAIDRIEEWLKKQQHIVKKDFSRGYIERTLILCKGSVEKAKTSTDKLCTLKTLLPNFFKNCDIKTDFKFISELAWLLPLPKMTKDYYRVFLVKINAKDFTSEHFMEYFRFNIAMFEYLKMQDYVKGFVVVKDYRNLNIVDLLTRIDLKELQQFMTILLEGYAARISGIHFITESKLINAFVTTLKQFLSKKMKERIFVHPTVESLHDVVEKNILPIEYGGEEKSVEVLNKQWFDIVSSEKHMEHLKEMNGACTDESLRSKDDFDKEYLGMPGTFRALNVD